MASVTSAVQAACGAALLGLSTQVHCEGRWGQRHARLLFAAAAPCQTGWLKAPARSQSRSQLHALACLLSGARRSTNWCRDPHTARKPGQRLPRHGRTRPLALASRGSNLSSDGIGPAPHPESVVPCCTRGARAFIYSIVPRNQQAAHCSMHMHAKTPMLASRGCGVPQGTRCVQRMVRRRCCCAARRCQCTCTAVIISATHVAGFLVCVVWALTGGHPCTPHARAHSDLCERHRLNYLLMR